MTAGIEDLRKQVLELTEALREAVQALERFAKVADGYDAYWDRARASVSFGECRAARAAVARIKAT